MAFGALTDVGADRVTDDCDPGAAVSALQPNESPKTNSRRLRRIDPPPSSHAHLRQDSRGDDDPRL